MRANGIAERSCTGDAPAYEKFLAWARTVPFTLRNPHCNHCELRTRAGELLFCLLSQPFALWAGDKAFDPKGR